MSKNEKKHRQGYWMGIGISIGIAMGAGFGLALENFGAGIGIGIAIGAGIGSALEQRHKDELRLLTEQEKIRQRRAIVVGVAFTTILLIASILIYILNGR
jgi:F0F1-type ATP synthase membrane subunit c/vacuolar-type H+-ATPase subunit K